MQTAVYRDHGKSAYTSVQCLVLPGVTLATHLEIIYCLLVAEKAVIVSFLYKYLCFFSLEMVHMSEKLKDSKKKSMILNIQFI